MKKLLIKEMKLTAPPITYIFLLFSLMAFIPSYPILIGAFFVCYGIFFTYQTARESQDVTYTMMLPIEKSQVVKAKFLFVVIIQVLAFLLFSAFTLIRMFFLNDVETYLVNNLINANLSFLGYVLTIFAIFNIIFLSMHFKTAYKIGIPFLAFSVVTFVGIVVFEILHHIPALTALNDLRFQPIQLIPFGIGIILYIVGTIFSLNVSINRFERVDL